MKVHHISAERLTIDRVRQIIEEHYRWELSDDARHRIARCREYLDEKMQRQKSPIYGVTRKFDPATLLPPLMVGIPYLLLIITATYYPEFITECLAKLLKMDTLPALTQGDVFNKKITTPEDIVFARAILESKGEK